MLKATLRTIGSVRLAAVLLLLLLVALAYATVFESLHGTERALEVYYRGWWFCGLLVLLAVNALAGLLCRLPYRRRQLGFVLTHAGLLVTLAGALVTQQFGVDGQLGLAEGQSTDQFYLTGREALVVNGGREPRSAVLDLAQVVRDRFAATAPDDAWPRCAGVQVGDLHAQVVRYLPDSEWRQQVSDDNPTTRPAVEVSLSPSGREDPVWVFPTQPTAIAATQVSFRQVMDRDELVRLLRPRPGRADDEGLVKIEHEGASFEFTVADGLAGPVPLGESGYTARVLRYLPHATVGPDRKVVNASDRPVNPYVEVELVGPAGTQMRRAFAKFPDFSAGHGSTADEGTKVRLLVGADAPATPVEVLAGPDGELYVRFTESDGQVLVRNLAVGEPVEAPWPGQRFAVLRRFEKARVHWSLEPVAPVRARRAAAILVRLSSGGQSSEIWLQKGMSRAFALDGAPYEVSYTDQASPLGFTVKLERFRIGRYPGSEQPRTFESHILVTDARSGQTQSAVVSMNCPFTFGGYTLYQASYQPEGDRWVSFLSVACDPGQPIVFAGYITIVAGMLVVLLTRMVERRHKTLPPLSSASVNHAAGAVPAAVASGS